MLKILKTDKVKKKSENLITGPTNWSQQPKQKYQKNNTNMHILKNEK